MIRAMGPQVGRDQPPLSGRLRLGLGALLLLAFVACVLLLDHHNAFSSRVGLLSLLPSRPEQQIRVPDPKLVEHYLEGAKTTVQLGSSLPDSVSLFSEEAALKGSDASASAETGSDTTGIKAAPLSKEVRNAMKEAREAVKAEEQAAQAQAEKDARVSYTKATAESIAAYKKQRAEGTKTLSPIKDKRKPGAHP